MRWPQLVPASICTEEVKVHLTAGLGADGVPVELPAVEARCNYSEKMRQVLDHERRLVALAATALFPGDLAPKTPQLEGWVLVRGIRREIFRAERARNPDGTVNYTKLELM